MKSIGLLRSLFLVTTAALAAGCGDPPSVSVDAAVDAPAEEDARPVVDAPIAGHVPAPPAMPVMTPCPPGWREIEEDGVALCDPWPASGPADCPAGEAHFPGTTGCAPLGPPCPSGEWPSGLPSGRPVIYVRASEPRMPGGSGTAADPYLDITSALAAAPAGAVIALGQGVHELGGFPLAYLEDGQWLVGACVSGTIVHPTLYAELNVMGAGVVIRDLTIGPGEGHVASVAGDSDLLVENLYAVDLDAYALSVSTASLTVRRVRIDGVRRASAGPGGPAFEVRNGGMLDAEWVSIARTTWAAVEVLDGGTVELSDVRLDGPIPSSSGLSTALVAGLRGVGTVRAERLAMRGASTLNTAIFDALEVDVRDAWLVGARVEALGTTTALARVVVEGTSATAALEARDAGSLTIADVLVRDTAASSAGLGGAGVRVTSGARLVADRTLIARSVETAMLFAGTGTTATLRDVSVVDVSARASNGELGRALQIQSGAAVDAERIAITLARELAVGVMDEGSTLVARDIDVTGTSARTCAATTCTDAAAGMGLGVYGGGAATLESFRLGTSALCGAQIAEGGELDLHLGEISESPVGVNLAIEGYDLTRLMDRVVFRGNGSNLDSATLPVPDARVSL